MTQYRTDVILVIPDESRSRLLEPTVANPVPLKPGEFARYFCAAPPCAAPSSNHGDPTTGILWSGRLSGNPSGLVLAAGGRPLPEGCDRLDWCASESEPPDSRVTYNAVQRLLMWERAEKLLLDGMTSDAKDAREAMIDWSVHRLRSLAKAAGAVVYFYAEGADRVVTAHYLEVP